MKIFGWMQNKLNGNNKLHSSLPKKNHRKEACKEELSDWPNGLLAIGTFGNDEIKDSNQKRVEENNSEELTIEGIKKLQNEVDAVVSFCGENRCSSNDDDREFTDNDRRLEASSSMVLSRGRSELCSENTSNGGIRRKSLSFILRKMFGCRSGLASAPSLRDQVPESRMEKILRAILHKKVYPQTSNPSMSMKKYLENSKAKEEGRKDDEKDNKGSKWVKTDSEYIVLEI